MHYSTAFRVDASYESRQACTAVLLMLHYAEMVYPDQLIGGEITLAHSHLPEVALSYSPHVWTQSDSASKLHLIIRSLAVRVAHIFRNKYKAVN